MSETESRGSNRIVALDTVRVFMVFCVIALHAAMTYMAYAVPWWYVLDSQSSLFFTILVVYLDSFPMTTLFFLSGYFAPLSLAKRTRGVFIADKLKHIGIPWVLGVLFVAPFFAAATMKAYLPVPPASEFLREEFFGRFYQQGHYWYLGILLAFLIVWALVGERTNAKQETAQRGAPSFSLFAVIWAVTVAAFCTSVRFVKPADEWFNVGYVLYFQPARIVGYALIFALGIRGGRQSWFTRDGWQPYLPLWLSLALASSCALVLWTFMPVALYGDRANLVFSAALYSLTALSMPFGLIGLFMRFMRARNRLAEFTGRFAPTSYGTYWLHQIVLMPLLFAMLKLHIPIGLKWTIGVVGTIAICQLLTRYVLLKLPMLRDIF